MVEARRIKMAMRETKVKILVLLKYLKDESRGSVFSREQGKPTTEVNINRGFRGWPYFRHYSASSVLC